MFMHQDRDLNTPSPDSIHKRDSRQSRQLRNLSNAGRMRTNMATIIENDHTYEIQQHQQRKMTKQLLKSKTIK